MDAVEITLPGGFAAAGGWHRTVSVRPLCGRDEAFLAEQAGFLLPVQRTTALLARTVERLGPCQTVTPAALGALAVGDREALLLHLRRLTLGERIACVLSCSNPACGEKLDLDLSVSDLLLPPYAYAAAVYERLVEGAEGQYLVRFRLPTGADQEAAALLAFDNLEAAAHLVLQRCIEQVLLQGAAVPCGQGIPSAVAQAVPQWMAELDPQAEVRLHLTCPACSMAFEQLFDAGEYFFQELTGQQEALYREVHLLAWHYHWSEADILAMPRHKRRLYLRLLAEATSLGRGS
jgi:hypothetical protein